MEVLEVYYPKILLLPWLCARHNLLGLLVFDPDREVGRRTEQPLAQESPEDVIYVTCLGFQTQRLRARYVTTLIGLDNSRADRMGAGEHFHLVFAEAKLLAVYRHDLRTGVWLLTFFRRDDADGQPPGTSLA